MMKTHTVTHSEDLSTFLNDTFHIYTILYSRCHWFFTQNVITLLCKSSRNLSMLVILNCNNDGVGKSFPDCINRLRRRDNQFLPCAEDQSLINIM